LPALNRDGIVLAQPGNCSAKAGTSITHSINVRR
jgi:hypothetical protein